MFVDEGETVQLGKELLTLTEPDFTITLFANPTDRSEIALGQVVTVELEAGDQEVEGRMSNSTTQRSSPTAEANATRESSTSPASSRGRWRNGSHRGGAR